MALACLVATAQSGSHPPIATKQPPQTQTASVGYVGSQECALCHPGIYEKYMKTDMGRAMAVVDGTFIATIPASGSVFEPRLNRHFEVYARDGRLYQTEYQLADAHEVFRDTRRVEWIMGARENGFGAIVREGDYLFEAPLSFYSNINGWALSPGYQFADYGFSRPILPGCIACHSGRPQPVLEGNGRFHNPPFQELGIGCENCHGPGEAHIAAASTDTIVNPAKLSGWQADNLCMGCHQTGDARVLHPGKDFGDFRPGNTLDDTLSIFMVPFGPESPPRDDLLEHYFSMRLSKCYRASQGKMSCITCHDPHLQPTAAEAPAYFRQKCLTCHTEQSCKVPLTTRQSQAPADDCAGCHMPKRNLKVISHSVLTNHRIVSTPQEEFPDSAFHMTTAALPDLVHLSALPGTTQPPPPLVLLQAYRQAMLSHPEYRPKYWSLAKELEQKEPNNVAVLEGLADLALQQKSLAGVTAAIRYLERARTLGSAQASDFEQLAKMLAATKQESRAIEVLKDGIQRIPYDAELYRLLVRVHSSLKQTRQACDVLTTANRLFPQDDSLRNLLRQCSSTQTTGSVAP